MREKLLVIQDYYSKFIELIQLHGTTSDSVISVIKNVFIRHGIPEIARTDNGPQFDSRNFKRFSEDYGFEIKTSSPHFPQSNGEAESGV